MVKVFLAEKVWSLEESSEIIGIFSTVDLAKVACEVDGGHEFSNWRETSYGSHEAYPYAVYQFEVDKTEG